MNTVQLYRTMHAALHNSEAKTVQVEENTYQVETTNKSIRYIRYKNIVFAQQDTTQMGYLAHLAKSQPISRIIRTGQKWGWISNKEIADPLLVSNDGQVAQR